MDPKELMGELVKAIVNRPEEVRITEVKGEQVTILEVKVAKEDLGCVIGRGGKNAMALRHILGVVSGKSRRHYLLDIVDVG